MSRIHDLARRLSVDRAIGYAIAMRAWQVPAGVITTVLIALSFNEQSQGIYYLLLSLIGLQSLVDSGLVNVMMHAVSHEWSRLRIDDRGFLRGPRRIRRRIAAMALFGLVWFALGALVLVMLGTGIGIAMFVERGIGNVAIHPLMVAMIIAGCSLTLAPFIAVLEGCNQVAKVNQYRLVQAITGSVVVWSCLVGGANLWTPVFAVTVQLIWELLLVFVRYGPLFRQLLRTAPGNFDWRKEIWPLQWRIGMQSAARHLAFFPLIPSLFLWQSPEIAGRAGMTWSVLNSLLLVAYAWIRTRAPEFGRLFADGKRSESNQAFLSATVGSTLLLMVAVSSFWIVLVILNATSFEIGAHVASRFLKPSSTIWFAVALLPLHLTQCFAIHLRSQKFDPIWRITIMGNLVLAVAILVAAKQWSVDVVGIAMLLTFSAVTPSVAAVWWKFDRYFKGVESATN